MTASLEEAEKDTTDTKRRRWCEDGVINCGDLSTSQGMPRTVSNHW